MSHDHNPQTKLVTMANQIAKFMESKPHAEGVAGLANHINDFWEPRMRRHLFDLLDQGGAGLHLVGALARNAAARRATRAGGGHVRLCGRRGARPHEGNVDHRRRGVQPSALAKDEPDAIRVPQTSQATAQLSAELHRQSPDPMCHSSL